MTVSSLGILAAVAVNVDVASPAVTVIEAGTERAVLVSVSVTAAPPLGATLLRVTVQVLDEFGPILLGLHANDDTTTGVTRLTAALADVPL